MAAADVVVRIPMAGGVDSLNVAPAAAVAFWATRVRTFDALADPTRRAILDRLRRGVGELAAPPAMSLPAVSRHLKVLQRAGLVTQGRDAGPLRDVDAWLGGYRAFFEGRLDRLEAQLGAGPVARRATKDRRGTKDRRATKEEDR